MKQCAHCDKELDPHTEIQIWDIREFWKNLTVPAKDVIKEVYVHPKCYDQMFPH